MTTTHPTFESGMMVCVCSLPPTRGGPAGAPAPPPAPVAPQVPRRCLRSSWSSYRASVSPFIMLRRPTALTVLRPPTRPAGSARCASPTARSATRAAGSLASPNTSHTLSRSRTQTARGRCSYRRARRAVRSCVRWQRRRRRCHRPTECTGATCPQAVRLPRPAGGTVAAPAVPPVLPLGAHQD